MADSSNRIGGSSSGTTAGYASVTQTAEGAAARGSSAVRGNSAGTPGAGRGRVERVVSSNQSPDQLDRNAPRGTYLNLLA